MSTSGRMHVVPLPAASDVRWRVVEIDVEGLRARLAPYLSFEAMAALLDQAFGVDGWSNRFLPFGQDAVGCELDAASVVKSTVVRSTVPAVDVPELAAAALTRAACLHGVRLPFDEGAAAWVDWDPDREAPLYWPDLADAAPAAASGDLASAAEPAPDAAAKPLGTPLEAPAHAPIRSEGQRAIDKLVDRLREAGRGLEAARLVNEHHGYGTDPEAARELYARLRRLLLDGTQP